MSENTLIYSGNQTNAHIHIFLLESNEVVYPCCVTIFPLDFKQHYSLKTKPSVSKNGLGRPQNDLGGCRYQAYHFSIKSYPCMPKTGSHSIQGMASHSEQTHKQIQTRNQIPLCFISIDINSYSTLVPLFFYSGFDV